MNPDALGPGVWSIGGHPRSVGATTGLRAIARLMLTDDGRAS